MILSSTEYFEQSFIDKNYIKAEIKSSIFNDCVFDRCNFTEATINNCRFINSKFINCDLGLMQVPGSSYSGVQFEKCKIIGVNWVQAFWPGLGIWEPIEFTKCALNHSTFLGVNLAGSRITQCEAINVDFREAKLSNVDFSFSDLNESLFHATDLQYCDLRDARNYQIDPTKNNLRLAKFSIPEAMSLLYSMEIEIRES